jgi:tetratricopeptide (TPR) repeat protein
LKARILDAAGRTEDADRLLLEGLRHSIRRPEIARQSALLLFRHGRAGEALNLLEKAIAVAPNSPDLPLTKAIVLGLEGRSSDAQITLNEITSLWPEWDRTYLAHGLLLEQSNRPAEARDKIRTAIALGSDNFAARCALARLDGATAPDPQCDCVKGLRELLFPGCAERSTAGVPQP